MSKEKQQTKISEELVLKEMKSFLSKWIKKVPEDEELEKEYPNIFDALSKGNLVIDEKGLPVYTLIEPITKEGFETSVITFKTRIKASTKASLAHGIDLGKDVLKFSYILRAHILGFASFKMLDELGKHDEDAVTEIASLFI